MSDAKQQTELPESQQEQIEQTNIWGSLETKQEMKWQKRSSYFHKLDSDYLGFLIPPGQRVLALGCGAGDKLAGLKPSIGIGVDISPAKIKLASRKFPNLVFLLGDIEDRVLLDSLVKQGPFDVIVLYDSLGVVNDIQTFLGGLKNLCGSSTRLVSVYSAYFWEPMLRLSEIVGLRKKHRRTTWLGMRDIENFFELSDFESVKREWRTLIPFKLLGVGPLVNKYIATLPFLRKMGFRHFIVARRKPFDNFEDQSVTVVIPCRNEKRTVEEVVTRLPKLGNHTEIIFVEGHSTDGTWEEIQRVAQAYKHLDIHGYKQRGNGKGDAVREGFSRASGDILIILDADLTVLPEDLPKFYEAIRSGKGEYINGSRLIYAMEDEAMRLLNYIANQLFAKIFSFMLNQEFTDTLCGTKVISRKNYIRLTENRHYFGDFDPFGDFDLIFGATKLNLKIVEVPVRYKRRSYGITQISRFRHGLLLVKMVIFAYRKLKLV
jgi:SAM-dependent methyltransferase